MLLGNENISIESYISSISSNPGIRGIGYFIINLKKQSYGIKSKQATALACSYDTVLERICNRGMHIIPKKISDLPVLNLANLIERVLYVDKYKIPDKFGISKDDFSCLLYKKKILWAPDGDEAFDDRSRIIQIDIDNDVRLIGYKVKGRNTIDIQTLTDLKMEASDYYLLLEKWAKYFLEEWETLNNQAGNT